MESIKSVWCWGEIVKVHEDLNRVEHLIIDNVLTDGFKAKVGVRQVCNILHLSFDVWIDGGEEKIGHGATGRHFFSV